MKRRLLFHVVFVSGAYYLSNGLYMVRGLLLARLLGPSVFGVWSAMRLTQTMASWSQLGVRHGLIQLAPKAQGAGDQETVERLRNTTSGIQLLAAGLLGVVVVAGAAFAGPWRAEWLVFAAVLLCVQIFIFYHAVVRSLQRFTRSGSGDVVIAVVSTAAGIMAAWQFGLLGFLVVLAFAYLAGLAVMLRGGPAYPPPRIERTTLRRLLGEGFPLMASGGLFTLLWNVDRLLLWLFQSTEALGIYSVQASFTTVALLAPSAVSTVLHPHLLERVGESGATSSLRPYLLRGGAVMAAFSAVVVAAGHVLLHLPIRWLVPEYEAAIEPGRILMIAAYFSMVATVAVVVVHASSGQRKLCVIRGGSIVVAATGGVLVLAEGFVWLAAAIGAGLALDGLWTVREAMRRCGVRGRAGRRLWAHILGAFALVLGSVWLAWSLVPDQPGGWQADLAASLVRTGIAVAPGGAWALWQLRQFRG